MIMMMIMLMQMRMILQMIANNKWINLMKPRIMVDSYLKAYLISAIQQNSTNIQKKIIKKINNNL